MIPRGVTASIEGNAGDRRFDGAAVLRLRPHPRTQEPLLQLGVPDDALGFRPERGTVYRIRIAGDEQHDLYRAGEVWLERVQSSWWFVLSPVEGEAAP